MDKPRRPRTATSRRPTPTLAPSEYATFLDALRASLADRGVAATVNPVGDRVAFTHPETGQQGAVALRPLVEACAGRPKTRSITEHTADQIDQMLRGYADQAAARALDADWSKARRRLMLRMYPKAYIDTHATQLTYRHIGGGLAAALVYDLPGSVFNVEPRVSMAWSVGPEMLWKTALANLRRELPPPTVTPITLPSGVRALQVSGDSFFITSRLLLLRDLVPPQSFPHGALAVVPHRHLMIFAPILTADQTRAGMRDLVRAAQHAFQNGPGPLTADLLWWSDGGVQRIPSSIDPLRQNVRVTPPAAFQDVLTTLRRAAVKTEPLYIPEEQSS